MATLGSLDQYVVSKEFYNGLFDIHVHLALTENFGDVFTGAVMAGIANVPEPGT